MPHYKDGTPAKVGDRVKGRGYNIKGVVEGYVLRVDQSSEKCNVTLGTTAVDFDENKEMGQEAGRIDPFCQLEYGHADEFEKAATT